MILSCTGHCDDEQSREAKPGGLLDCLFSPPHCRYRRKKQPDEAPWVLVDEMHQKITFTLNTQFGLGSAYTLTLLVCLNMISSMTVRRGRNITPPGFKRTRLVAAKIWKRQGSACPFTTGEQRPYSKRKWPTFSDSQ